MKKAFQIFLHDDPDMEINLTLSNRSIAICGYLQLETYDEIYADLKRIMERDWRCFSNFQEAKSHYESDMNDLINNYGTLPQALCAEDSEMLLNIVRIQD
jgi:hypothetical protein